MALLTSSPAPASRSTSSSLAPALAKAREAAWPMPPAAPVMTTTLSLNSIATSSSIGVGDRQLVRRVEGDHLGAGRCHDDLLLDARGGEAVARRAIGLEREHHAFLDFHRVVEGVEPADDRPLVQPQSQPVAEQEAERLHLAGETDLLRLGPARRDLVGGDTGFDQRDRCVDPFARALVGVLLRIGGAADIEGAVVAGAISHEGLDDVEERLVA